ncbi:MAG: acetylglutamate kinase [Candidatus Coatesbacteria bacterium]
MKHAIAKADTLLEALPYLRQFRGATFVIKYGGSIQDTPGGEESVVEDLLFLHSVGIWPVVVHGGGKEISEAQKQAGLAPRFVQGLRVTDDRTMALTDRILGRINARIVAKLGKFGDDGAGFSGKKGAVLIARKRRLTGVHAKEDLGHVGEVVSFNMKPLLRARNRVPIFSSVAVGKSGELYNVNADDVAAALAGKLRAAKLVLMTDVAGIQDGAGNLLSSLTPAKARALIGSGVISRGMIPKVRACLNALSQGVGKAHIIDGRLRHSVLLEIFTLKGVGTEIVKS